MVAPSASRTGWAFCRVLNPTTGTSAGGPLIVSRAHSRPASAEGRIPVSCAWKRPIRLALPESMMAPVARDATTIMSRRARNRARPRSLPIAWALIVFLRGRSRKALVGANRAAGQSHRFRGGAVLSGHRIDVVGARSHAVVHQHIRWRLTRGNGEQRTAEWLGQQPPGDVVLVDIGL